MTTIKADEIVRILREQIAGYQQAMAVEEVGSVISVGDGIARIYGLEKAMMGEMLAFPHDVYGIALNLEEDQIGAVLLGDYTEIKEGDLVRRTRTIVSVPVGEALIGRVVNPLGQPVDGKGEIKTSKWRTIENRAPGVVERQGVKQPLQTGIRAIDSLIPIGKGQRELIIGDRSTGKTAIELDTIINQRGKNVFCIYVAIGQKNSTVAALAQTLEQKGAMEYTTIVAVGPSEAAALRWIAPFAGCAMGEELMYQGKDVLIIYDDLTKHAHAYREMSLLLRRPPGREAYPGDIFYLHSRLLERAAKLSDDLGGGSLTALPIIETKEGDISAYIPTNVISITDGQIFLELDLFNSGQRPAMNVGTSVSRVGGSAQIKAMKAVSGGLKLDLANFRELESFASFGAELDKASQALIDRGRRLMELLKQSNGAPLPVEEQVVSLYAGTRGHLDDLAVADIRRFEAELLEDVRSRQKELLSGIREGGALPEEQLEQVIGEFKARFRKTEVEEA